MTLDEIQAEAKKLYEGADDIGSIASARAAAKMAAKMIFYLAREMATHETVADVPSLPNAGSFDGA